MRTTIDLPDELLVAAKKRAAESRTTLREIFERGLRRELSQRSRGVQAAPSHWVSAAGGLPPRSLAGLLGAGRVPTLADFRKIRAELSSSLGRKAGR